MVKAYMALSCGSTMSGGISEFNISDVTVLERLLTYLNPPFLIRPAHLS